MLNPYSINVFTHKGLPRNQLFHLVGRASCPPHTLGGQDVHPTINTGIFYLEVSKADAKHSAQAKRPATANSTQHFLILPHLAPTLVEVLPLLLVSRKLIDTASRIAWQIDTS